MTTFGEKMLALMKERGISLRGLAKATHYDVGYLSKVANDLKRPSFPLVERLEAELGADGSLLELVPRERARRRSGAENAVRHGDLQTLSSSEIRISSARSTDIVVIRDVLRALTASDRQFGGHHARAYAADYLQNVITPRLHISAAPAVRRALFSVATEFSLRVAAMHLDAGHPHISKSMLGTAFAIAQESDDVTLAAWVLARRGEQEIHEATLAHRRGEGHAHQAHLNQALAYTSGAAAMAAAAPPTARAFILTKQALSTSLMGDRSATLDVLAQVWAAYEQVGSRDEPEWMEAYGWGHLSHETSRCYYHLGMGDEAVRAAEESLQVRRDIRPRAFSLGVQIIGLTQTKSVDIERACALSYELIETAAQLGSRRVTIRLNEALAALSAYRGLPAVRSVFEAARQLPQSE
ncbi:helix-turn-helix transcriptional regulator [Nonomuraea sp. NPDC046802]|uniref:helix-turn-helix domain-containing protein n=1 Tax=Nonomuraea sp. NPDC046802 TaxID=3154919 RepID=UPI0033EB56A6